MPKDPKRITYALLDSTLQALFESGWKIVPITRADILANVNTGDYEYVRPAETEYNNEVYRWDTDHYELLSAQDKSINWVDIVDPPATYTPSAHTHINDHSHTNKTVLDGITAALITKWNTIDTHDHSTLYYNKTEVDGLLTNKSAVGHKHTEVDITGLDKYTKSETDALLLNKAAASHDHDGRYYTESEMNTLLGQKAALGHNHDTVYAVKATEGTVSNHETRLLAIEGGYSEGHSHLNLEALDTITATKISNWDALVGHNHSTLYAALIHSHDDLYYTESEMNTFLAGKSDAGHNHDANYYTEAEVNNLLSSKAEATTLSGHIGSSIIHITADERTAWTAKLDLTFGTVQPSLGFWFKEV